MFFAFRKIWRSLFSCYLRFEICLFALLPTIFECLLMLVVYCCLLFASLASFLRTYSFFILNSFKGSPISLFHIKFSDNIHNQTVNNIRMQRRIQKPVKYLRWNFLRNFLTTSKYSDSWQGFEWLWEMRFCLVTVYLYTEMYWRNEYTGM